MTTKLSFLARSVIVICMLVVGCSQAWADNRKVTVYWESTTKVSTAYPRVKVDDGTTTFDKDGGRPSSRLGPITIDGTSYWYHEFNSIPTTVATDEKPLFINFCYGDDSNEANLTWATNINDNITSLPSNNVSLFYKYSDGHFYLAKTVNNIGNFKVYFRYQDDSKACTAVDGSSHTISLSTTTDAKGYTWYYATFPGASPATGTVTVSDVDKNYTFNTNSEKWYVITGNDEATEYPSKEKAESAETSKVTIHYRAQINGVAEAASITTKDNNGNYVTATGTGSYTDDYDFEWKTASYNAPTSSYSADISAAGCNATISSITSDRWIVLKGASEYTVYASMYEAEAAEKKAVSKTITIYYRDGASISNPSGYLEVGKKSTDYDPEAMLVDERGNEWHYQSFLIDKNKGMSFNSYTDQMSDVWLIGSTKYDTKADALADETDNSWYFVSPELTNSLCLPAFRLGNIINRGDKDPGQYALNNDKYTFHMKDCDIQKFVDVKKYSPNTDIHYWIQNTNGSIKYTPKGDGIKDNEIYQDLRDGKTYIFVKGIGDSDRIHVWKNGGSDETTWPGSTLSKSNTLTINGESGWYYYKTNGSSDRLQINNGTASWKREFDFSGSITLKISNGEGTTANVTSYPEPSGSAIYVLGSNKTDITNSANSNYIYRSGESYAECQQSSSSKNSFVLKQNTAQSYTWTLNTGNAYGNDARDGATLIGDTPITYDKESVTIEMNYQHGDLESDEHAKLAIPEYNDHKFYLIGNLDGTDFFATNKYPMTRNVYYPNDNTKAKADSITYTLTLNAPKQGFGRMFAGVINSKMWETYGPGGPSDEDAPIWYGSVIRPQVPMNRDAIALYGGLISNGNYNGTAATYKQGSQALTPRVDESKVSSYIIHVNLTTATYWIELLESSDDKNTPVGSKLFYIAGPAVSGTDEDWAVYETNGTRRTGNQHVMTYSPDDQCYIATVHLTHGKPFRFMIGDYTHNFGEDNVAPRTETDELALGASHIETCETNYFNMVNENLQTDVNIPKIGKNIMFNLPDGTYTVRFYTQMYKGTYGQTPSFGGQYYYTIDYHIGMVAGADGVAASSIPGDDFVCYKNWSDHLAYVCPETIKMYYVEGFKPEAQSAVMAKFKPSQKYIPANTPLILGSNASIVKDQSYTYIIKPLDPYGLLLNDSEFTKVRVTEGQTNNNDNKLLPVYHKTPVNAGTKNGDYYTVRNYGFGTLMPNGGSMKALRFWRIVTQGTDISAHKCYLAIPNTEGIDLEHGLDPYTMPSESLAKSMTWIWANDIIEDNESDNNGTEVETPIFTAKTDDNAVYNMQGIRLNKRPTTPGLYIIGGKKVLIK